MAKSALPRLIARVLFVDHVDAALAAHDAAVGFALLERLERIGDFHVSIPVRNNKPRNVENRRLRCQAKGRTKPPLPDFSWNHAPIT